jgi:hypothetical protein
VKGWKRQAIMQNEVVTKTADTRSISENKYLKTEFDTAFSPIETAKRTLN